MLESLLSSARLPRGAACHRSTSTCTSTPSTRCSTGRAASTSSSNAAPSSACPPSASPTTARSRARSSSTRRPTRPGSSRSSGARSTSSTTAHAGRNEGEKSWAHLTLIAESNEGYHNLHQALHARLPRGLLLQAAGRLRAARALRRRDHRPLRLPRRAGLPGPAVPGRAARRPPSSTGWSQIFGKEDVYVELQDATSTSTGRQPGPQAARRRAGLPVVGTGDVHYLRAEDAGPHEALLCIQTNDLLQNPNRFKFATREFYLKSPSEMSQLMTPWGGDALLAPTLEIAERCNVELELGQYRLPLTTRRRATRSACLRRLCEKGLVERYGDGHEEIRNRLEFELQTDPEMGFPDYFLIVWDFVDFAKRNDVTVGPGRGSAAGSLVAYVLRSPTSTPSRYDLLFERFLNPGRKSMPDIDIDFSVHGREKVMRYVTEKYGRDRVAQIITFSKMAAKASVRDAGRVMGLPYGIVDRIAKMIPRGPEGRVRPTASSRARTWPRRRRGRDRAPDRRAARAARGPGAGRLDPRRRRGDRRPPAARVRPAAAEGRRLRARDPVPDGRRRGPRPAQDGLPGAAQPRRARRGRAARARVLGRRPRRLRDLPLDDPKTYEMLCARRHARRLPVRVVGHARGPAPGQADPLRRPDRARRAVPARARWPTSRCTPGARTASSP